MADLNTPFAPMNEPIRFNKLVLFPMSTSVPKYGDAEHELGFFSYFYTQERLLVSSNQAFQTIYKEELIARENPPYFFMVEKRGLGESLTFESIRAASDIDALLEEGKITRYRQNMDGDYVRG